MTARSPRVQNLVAKAARSVEGLSFPRPRGVLSGHAGGLDFEGPVDSAIARLLPGRSMRQFAALNHVLARSAAQAADPANFRVPADYSFGPSDLHYLISRGKAPTRAWRPDAQFIEQQQDTAETIIFSSTARNLNRGVTTLVDVKSQKLEEAKSRPPNIISQKKIADVAEIVLRNNLTPSFDILYAAVGFRATGEPGNGTLVCEKTRTISLLDVPTSYLKINWTAGHQIQFDPWEVPQDYAGTTVDWLRAFLLHCAASLEQKVSSHNARVAHLRKVAEL
jgi:hypothetical protein